VEIVAESINEQSENFLSSRQSVETLACDVASLQADIRKLIAYELADPHSGKTTEDQRAVVDFIFRNIATVRKRGACLTDKKVEEMKWYLRKDEPSWEDFELQRYFRWD